MTDMQIGAIGSARRPDWADVLARAASQQRRRRASRRAAGVAAVLAVALAVGASPGFGLSGLRSLLGLAAKPAGLSFAARLEGPNGSHGSLLLKAPQTFVGPSSRPFAPTARAHPLRLRWALALTGFPRRTSVDVDVEGAVALHLCNACRQRSGQTTIPLSQLARLMSGRVTAVVVATSRDERLSGPVRFERPGR
jgi:hypothetical protein